MARIALINASVVENVIEATQVFADTLGYDYAVESATASIGWTYDGSTFTPNVPVVKDLGRIVTKLAFRNRFTIPERAGITLAANDPANIVLRVAMDDLAVSDFIDLTRQEILGLLLGMESSGLLAVGRASEIITTPVSQGELP